MINGPVSVGQMRKQYAHIIDIAPTVGRCRFTASKAMFKARLISAPESDDGQLSNFAFKCKLRRYSTILEAVGIEAPAVVDGFAQQPIHGQAA